jgi:hypothetical protein
LQDALPIFQKYKKAIPEMMKGHSYILSIPITLTLLAKNAAGATLN